MRTLILIFFLITYQLHAISLRDAVVKVLDTNPNVLSEKLNKEAFSKYVDEEKGDYYPTLDLEAYLEDSKTRSDRDDEPNDPSTADKDGWHLNLEFEQVLYDGGLTPSEVEEYRHSSLSNKFRSDLVVEEIMRRTVDSYLSIVQNQELMDITNINLRIHDDYLVMAKEKEEVSGEILETYQVNSKKHFLRNSYLDQEMTKQDSTNALVELIGTEKIGHVCRPVIDKSLIPRKLEDAIEDALRKNPRILQAVENIKEQREKIVQANAGNLPTLKFQWRGSWDDDLAYAENGRQDISRFRLLMEWNLFEGGKTQVVKEREILFLQERQKVLDTIVNEVTQQVKTTYTKYFDYMGKIENYKRYVNDNLNIKQVYVKQLADGTRTFIDILNAESEYFRSSNDLLNFEYEMMGLYYDMLQQRGLLSYALLSSPKQKCEPFVPTKFVSAFQKVEDNSELEDVDLLSALGESVEDVDVKQNDSEIMDMLEEDTEVNNLINEDSQTKAKNDKPAFPEGKYTVHLGTFDDTFSLEYFLEDTSLDKEKIISYMSNKKLHLLYGSYEDLFKAMNAVNNLDSTMKFQNAYVDSLEKHKEAYDKSTYNQ